MHVKVTIYYKYSEIYGKSWYRACKKDRGAEKVLLLILQSADLSDTQEFEYADRLKVAKIT